MRRGLLPTDSSPGGVLAIIVARRNDDINTVTPRNNLSALRALLRWCGHAEIEISTVPKQGRRRRTDRKENANVNINDGICDVLDDYIEVEREDVVEERGRESLFTTPTARPSEKTATPS